MAAAPLSTSPRGTIEGTWQGALAVGGGQLHVVVHFHQAGDRWTATVDSPDQGAAGIPVDEVTFDGARVTFKIVRLVANFDGTRAGDEIKGTFTQGAAALPLVLAKTAHPLQASVRPQEPRRPLPYDEVELTVPAGSGNGTLACTLTRPRGAGRFAAAVLATGSGPQDRNEALAGHKPFLVLADALTRKGIAVLRCDDRGVGKSTGTFAGATTLDFVADTLAQVAAVRARPDIDGARVGIAGHSEGGLIAPMAAAQSKEVAFIVMLAGPGVRGDEILRLQGALLNRAAGKSDAEVKRNAALLEVLLSIVKSEKDDVAAAKRIRAHYAALPEAERKALGSSAELDAQIAGALTPWFRTFLTLDPQLYLRKVTVPVLAINGEKDLQVPPRPNLPEIAKALAGNPDVTVKVMPGLNHLFQHCQTGSPDEYALIAETMSPAALDLVGDWIVAHTRAK